MNKISSITRKHILERVFGSHWAWHGRMNEVDFLNRIWTLDNLPSTDGRFKDMFGDIFQHRINNDDYAPDWIITDNRLNILETEDSIFIKFLTEILHPEVVENANSRDDFASIFNQYLINDGFEITPVKYVSGEPIYGLSEINEADSLRDVLLKLEAGCIAVSTDGKFSDSEYHSLLNILRKRRDLYQLLPEFVRSYKQTQFIRSKMQSINEHYAERREYIQSAFVPSFQFVDSLSGISDPFSDTIENIENGTVIGQGGFGIVYKVKHKYIDQSFAIKIFRKHPFSTGEHDSERFFKEANILFGLNHPNIIHIYDIGMYNGEPFIRMEYFSGKNLSEILIQHGRLTATKALSLISAVASALAYAYKIRRVVHRDLKPSNIMAATPEQFKVIDFGLGVYVEDELRSRLTKTGEVVASGVYSAPELLSSPKLIDPRCDIYSLGAIWYECLLNRPPQGSGIIQALSQEAGIPDEQKRIIEKMLQSDSGQRYVSWPDLTADLAKCSKHKND